MNIHQSMDCPPCVLDIYFNHPFFSRRRIAVRHDTCAIVALSLNMAQKVHPIIWSQSNLPYDCTQVMPVPKPIGKLLS